MLTVLADIRQLESPVDPLCASGENLAYTDSYAELERLAHGRSEQQFGKSVYAAEQPEWDELVPLALDLASQTHDLRVGVYLTQGLVRTRGISGLADGLGLLASWLSNEWDTLHPALDPNDGDEAVERSNILLELCDYERTLAGLARAPLATSRDAGACSLRDVRIARGEGGAESPVDAPTWPAVEAIFSGAERLALDNTRTDVVRAGRSLEQMIQVFQEQTGTFPNLDPVTDMLKEILGVVDELTPAIPADEPQEPVEQHTIAETPAPSTPTDAVGGGPIRSRRDVIVTLDALCEYYKSNEPSSPVPLLLMRARKLVDKQFLEIVRNLAPDGLAELSRWVGDLEPGGEN